LIYEILSSLLDEEIFLFPSDELIRAETLASSKELLAARLYVLNSLINNKANIVIANIASVSRYLPAPETFKHHTLNLKIGDKKDINELKTLLIESGYSQVNKIDQSLQFACRGDIVDIFSVNSDNSTKLPISTEYFRDLCMRFMDEHDSCVVKNLSLEPPRENKATGSVFLDTWYTKERNLRLALAQLRALKMHKDTKDLPTTTDGELIQAARTATGMDSPLSAEQYLNEYRLALLDKIAPLDMFSVDAVYCYGLKLMLTERMKKFNRDEGLASYHKIYDEILGETK